MMRGEKHSDVSTNSETMMIKTILPASLFATGNRDREIHRTA